MDSKNCYSLKRKNKYSNRVVRIIKNAENSEDSELDASDDEPDKVLAPDFYCDDIANKFIENEWLSETDLEDNESISDFENNEHFEDKENILPASDNVPQPERFEKKLAPNQKRNEQIISWKSGGEVNYPIPTWKGCMPPPCIDEPGTPLFYFKQMISENLLNNIVDQSNLYAIQKNVNKPLGLTLSELEKFIGITMLMSIYKLPRTHMFWKMETQVSQVVNTMSRNRWEEIKSNLHFNNNQNVNLKDKAYKIRLFLDSVTENMKRIPMEETLCVDEQMIPFKGKHSIKQYMKKKPRKWGFKAFVLCDSNGITHNWELYTGASLSSTELPNVGVSGNIVLRLCSIVPKNLNYKVYFDNWFNNIPLQVELEKTGLNYLGTIRPNRLKGCQFSSDKDMRRKGRGTMEEYYTIVDDIRIIATKWFDNKPVHLLSSFVGIKPVTTIKRYDRQQNKKIDVDFPESIKFYNRFMGGVDLADSLISLYRTEIRSKKWYLKIFFHILDLSVVNGWLLYRRDCNYFKIEAKNQYNLLDFKSELANTLCQKGLRCNIRGRPRSTEIEHGLSEKRKRGPTVSVPPKEVRFDQTSH